MKNIHIAIGSTMSRPGNVAENLKEIAAFARQAGEVAAHDVNGDALQKCQTEDGARPTAAPWSPSGVAYS